MNKGRFSDRSSANGFRSSFFLSVYARWLAVARAPPPLTKQTLSSQIARAKLPLRWPLGRPTARDYLCTQHACSACSSNQILQPPKRAMPFTATQ
jgi:hypothetical protein